MREGCSKELQDLAVIPHDANIRKFAGQAYRRTYRQTYTDSR